MRLMKPILLLFFGIIFCINLNLHAQTSDLQFEVVLNNGTNFDVKVQIQGSSTFKLGKSNIVFTFNFSDINNPSLLTAHNFSGGFYLPLTVTEPVDGRASINIDLGVPGNGTNVNTTWVDVATVRFSTLNSNGNSDLAFRTITPNATGIFKDDNATLVAQRTWSALNNHPLPVELTSFTATTSQNTVDLKWQTKTEVANYGFEVERKIGSTVTQESSWGIIGFIQGRGNSNSPIDYSFIDENPIGGSKFFYRLKQIDTDGKFEYSKEIEVELVPEEFNLFQNYPNPFNPTTTIKFALQKAGIVNLTVYNMLGEQIVTLINEVKEAGFYDVQFDARNLSTGIYVYRLSAGDFIQTKKLTLMK